MNTAGLIDEAVDLMERGKDGQASHVLLTAAIECDDPSLAPRIKELGEQGLERAGRFRKGNWNEIVKLAEARMGAAV